MARGAADPAKRIFLLDGHSLSYRAFFALPATLATSTGQITNAVYGFTSMLIKLLAEERPDYIAVAFDVGAPTVRLEKYAEYKAGRPEAPDEFRQQLGLIVEVLEALRIPVIGIEGHEADDAIATLAVRAAERGIDAVIVTADRDFFQLVGPGIRVMFNVKGISEIKLYDEAAVLERFGLPASKYLDYVALKGDPSDNIPGVPGVGEKTASKLVQDFGSVEELLARTEELKGRIKSAIQGAGEQLALNKDLVHLHTDLDLDIAPEDCVRGAWDGEEVRRLFTSLEFRTLLERLEDVERGARPAAELAELDLREVTEPRLRSMLATAGPKAIRFQLEDRAVRGVAVSLGGGEATFASVKSTDAVAEPLGDPGSPKWAHDAKAMETAAIASGTSLAGVAFDTMLAGYLLDPATADYPLGALCERYLGADVLGTISEEPEGQLFAETWRTTAAEAAAVALLAPVMAERIDKAGLRTLLESVELPLSSVLARMQARGVALDVGYLEEMAEAVRGR
ncbi:MAG: 5'-3' exonuclease H3TH domain-containing protein, partial [Actinomycetota bacterium]